MFMYIIQYIYICQCIVCVCERDRDRERQRETVLGRLVSSLYDLILNFLGVKAKMSRVNYIAFIVGMEKAD